MAAQPVRPRRNPHRIHGIHSSPKTLLLRIHRSAPQTMTISLSLFLKLRASLRSLRLCVIPSFLRGFLSPLRSTPHFLGTPISRLAPSAIRCSGGSYETLFFFFLYSSF